ncbi:MAG: RpiB/LacA/LacB family sugar-phosphate isomerase, partial [Myxococcales bacterium]
MAKTLIVGSDHAGLELKRELSGIAAELGYEVVDLGTHTSDSTDYP